MVGLKAHADFFPCKRRGTKVINEKPKLCRGCAVRSGEWPAWFSFWFSGCWRALAKGTAWAGFYSAIRLLLLASLRVPIELAHTKRAWRPALAPRLHARLARPCEPGQDAPLSQSSLEWSEPQPGPPRVLLFALLTSWRRGRRRPSSPSPCSRPAIARRPRARSPRAAPPARARGCWRARARLSAWPARARWSAPTPFSPTRSAPVRRW